MSKPSGGRSRREPCAKCGLPVFIAERLNVGKQLYHRTCFRCARCNSQLTLANYYETETNQFCCEVCPDEEQNEQDKSINFDKKSVLSRSLSDEEKSVGLQKFDEITNDKSSSDTIVDTHSAAFLTACSRFISSQLDKSENSDCDSKAELDLDESELPELPDSEPPYLSQDSESYKDFENINSIVSSVQCISYDSGYPSNTPSLDLVVQNSNEIVKNQPETANDELDINKIITKENKFPETKKKSGSLVKSRMLLFEKKNDEISSRNQISEQKFIPKVPFREEAESFTGSQNKTIDLESIESDSSINISLADGKFKNSKNHIKENTEDSCILISSEESLIEKDVQSPISISDEESLIKNNIQSPVLIKAEESSIINNTQLSSPSIDEESLTKNDIQSPIPIRAEQTLIKNNLKSPTSSVDEESLIKNSVQSPLSISGEESSIRNNIQSSTPNISEDSLVKNNIQSPTLLNSEVSLIRHYIESPTPSTDEQSLSKNNIQSTPSIGEESLIKNDIQSLVSISDEKSLIQNKDEIKISGNEESLKTTDKNPLIISDNSINKDSDDYPEHLNPFGDEEEEDVKQTASISLNPFDSDDNEPDKIDASPKPAIRKKIKVKKRNTLNITVSHLDEIYITRESYNPYADDQDDKIPLQHKKVLCAPKISLNPFWSDGEEPEDNLEIENEKPVPLPRNTRSTVDTPEPRPRKLSVLTNKSMFGSNTSLSSAHSSIGPGGRKKKPAPQPPAMDKQNSSPSSFNSSPSTSVQHSPKSTPKVRKNKKAPQPPSSTSYPELQARKSSIGNVSPVPENIEQPTFISEIGYAQDFNEWEKEKNVKDEVNRNRQSQIFINEHDDLNLAVPNKSTYGKWKRRKGPAPSRPIPQRRNIKPLPVIEIKRELEFIEIQQQGLEKQGVRIEQMIREKCEGPDTDLDSSLTPEVEDLILQLFELVNEKNDLFRKQTELMYLRRQQRLEEEHADLEYQIRCLMYQPEANKTDSDKAREEELINRLVEVVERKNEIVQCLEMDRVREAEEDDSISNQLSIYVSMREEELQSKSKIEETKHKKKMKKRFKFKTGKKLDADKDIDECESSKSSPVKDKKKKKFNIF